MWYKHGRTMLHPKDAFDDAIRNGMDEEGEVSLHVYVFERDDALFQARRYAGVCEVQPSA